MKLVLLVISLIVALPATAEHGPGVWESLQQGAKTKALILEVEKIDGTTPSLEVTFETENQLGVKITQTLKVCPPKDTSQTEVWTAMDYHRNREKLEQAERSRKPIEINAGSTWQSCLSL